MAEKEQETVHLNGFSSRSKHHLKISRNIAIPLILYLSSPNTFTQKQFDSILDVLHNTIQQDLIIDSHSRHITVSTDYTPQNPYYHSYEPKFCYYWIDNKSYHTVCVPTVHDVVEEEKSDSKKSSRRNDMTFTSIKTLNMELVICVLTDSGSSESDQISIQTGLKQPHQISQFFEDK